MIMLSFASCLCIYSCLCTTSYDIDETFCNCVGTSLCTSGSLVFVFVFVFVFAPYFVFVFAFVSQNPFAFLLGHWDKPVHQWVLGGASISIHILHRASHQRYLGHLHHHHHIIVIINILHRASHQGHLCNNGEMKLFSSPK